jgi:flagellar motor protein MotB
MGREDSGGDDEDGGVDPDGWMITFSDLLTLMLTFFVLLFSMSSLDAKALKELTESDALSGGDGVLEAGEPDRVAPPVSVPKPTVMPAEITSVREDLAQYLRMVGRGVSNEHRRILEQRMMERGKQEKVEISFLPNGIQLTFEEDENNLDQERISGVAQDQLRMVGDAAIESGARVRVETNARGDDLNSWLSATQRASNISEFIRRHSGLSKTRNRLGVAPKDASVGQGKVRMVLEMPKSKEKQ